MRTRTGIWAFCSDSEGEPVAVRVTRTTWRRQPSLPSLPSRTSAWDHQVFKLRSSISMNNMVPWVLTSC